MGFDCLVIGETNVREESKFRTRLSYLDEFIQEFLERINHIADEFSNHYLIPLAVS